MKRSCSQPGLLLGLLSLMLCAAPTAQGCGDDDEVRVTVVAIVASEKSDRIDPKLKELANCIQKKYPELKGFRLGKVNRETVEIGKERKFDLGDGKSAAVTVGHGSDEKNRVGIALQLPCCGKCQFETCCGKFFPLKTCQKMKDGECLIVAIRVETCPGK
jgi:hypothetical protein